MLAAAVGSATAPGEPTRVGLVPPGARSTIPSSCVVPSTSAEVASRVVTRSSVVATRSDPPSSGTNSRLISPSTWPKATASATGVAVDGFRTASSDATSMVTMLPSDEPTKSWLAVASNATARAPSIGMVATRFRLRRS